MREKADAFVRFENEVNQIQNRILNSMDRYESALIQARGFFLLNSPRFTRENFRNYVETIGIFERYPGAQGLGFTLFIKPSDLQRHTLEMRKLGFLDYKVWPEGEREIYSSILYLEPMNWRNRRAIGFDMFSEPVRNESMIKARDSGQAALSGKVFLVQETNKNVQSGFNLYLPYYKNQADYSTVEERRENIVGFIYMPFRSSDFFKELFKDETRMVNFKVYDGKAKDNENLLFEETPERSDKPLFKETREIDLAQHAITVEFISLPEIQTFGSKLLPYISALIGLVITLLVANIKKTSFRVKNAIEESLVSSEKLKLVSDQIPALVAYLNPNETFAWVNKAYEKFYGVSLNSFSGKDVNFLLQSNDYQKIHPFLKAAFKGKYGRLELELENAQNVKRNFLVDFVPDVSTRGELRGVVTFAHDITEQVIIRNRLKESEFHFRRFADSIDQLAWIADAKGIMTWTNRRWIEYTGVDNIFMNEGRWKEVVHPDHIDYLVQAMNQAWFTPEPWEITIQLKSKEGQWRWFLIRGVPITDEKNEIIQWLGTSTDVTDHMKTEESLKDALKTRDNFLSIASHELKTPITSLLIQTQMFARSIEKKDEKVYQPEKMNKFIDVLSRQVTRLTRLVDDMLDVSRIQSGKLKIEKEKFDLFHLLDEIISRMENTFVASQVPIPKIMKIGDTVGAWDRLRIEQVVVNLLTNALKYGEGSPIHVDIKGSEEAVVLSVKDHGRGVSSENHERIFNRFERGMETNEISGLGLGLFISKQIIDEHSGKIWVESQLGNGSTFFVVLPK